MTFITQEELYEQLLIQINEKPLEVSESACLKDSILFEKNRESSSIEKNYNTIPLSLSFQQNSILNSQFLDFCKEELGTPLDFQIKSEKKQKISYNNVLSKKINYEMDYIYRLFPEACDTFCKDFNYCLSHKDEKNSRIDKKFPRYKVEETFSGCIKFVLENKPPFIPEVTALPDDGFENLINKINPKYLFSVLVMLCKKHSMDDVFSKDLNNLANSHSCSTEILKNPFTHVKRSVIQYSFQRVLLKYFISLWLTSLSDDNFFFYTAQQKMSNINDLLKNKGTYLFSQDWYQYSFDLTMLCLEIYAGTDAVISVEVNTVKNRKSLFYGLPSRITHSVLVPEQIPMIVKPTILKTNKDIMRITDRISFGSINIRSSKEAFTALNLIHFKMFRINIVYFNILNNFYASKINGLETFALHPNQRPFHSQHQFMKTVLDFENIFKSSTLQKLRTMQNQRQLLLSSLTICTALNGFPIYFSDKLGYRTRMHPWQYSIFQTHSYLKHLLMDFSPEKLTIDGLINLMRAYYKISLRRTEEFEDWLLNVRKVVEITFTDCKVFFEYRDHNSYLIAYDSELPYFILLQNELRKVFQASNLPNTHISVEINQDVSSVVYLALFLRNRRLASACNLISNYPKEPFDVYMYVSRCIENFLVGLTYSKNSKGEEITILNDGSHKVFEFFQKTRKASKYALIGFCYNQTQRERLTQWVNIWEEVYEESPSNYEYEILNKFANSYGLFLEKLFPNLRSQLDRLTKALEILLKAGSKLKLKTLDGSVLHWDFYKTVSKRRYYYNPSADAHCRYRLKSISEGDQEQPLVDIRRHKTALLPNIIHSIDAAIMRIVTKRLYERTGYTINYFHDCVLLHPNHVDIYYEIITELFTSKDFLNMADNLFFDAIKTDLDIDTAEQISNIQKEFLEVSNDLVIEQEKYRAYSVYPFKS
jgi:hypothetical protein